MYIAIWAQNPDQYKADTLVENGKILLPEAIGRTKIINQMSMVRSKGRVIYDEKDRLFVSRQEKKFVIRFRTQIIDEFNRKMWSSIFIDADETNTHQREALVDSIKDSLNQINLGEEFPSIEKSIDIVYEELKASNSSRNPIILLLIALLILLIIGAVAVQILRN